MIDDDYVIITSSCNDICFPSCGWACVQVEDYGMFLRS